MPPEHGVVSSNLTGRATFNRSLAAQPQLVQIVKAERLTILVIGIC